MKCHKCNHNDTKVIESREVAEGESTRRRRKCPECNARFTTYERLERPPLVVIKQDGSRQMFDRSKLASGLARACDKTHVTAMQIEKLVADIENQLYSEGEPEISSHRIGELVIDNLSELSEVAYVRFASVYRRFSDITGFESELEQIRAKKSNKNNTK